MDPADPGAAGPLPDPALIVLVGPSGSGKSFWAAEHYRPAEVVSSDRLRAVVGSGEHDLDASADAFALLDQIVAARLRRGLTAVVDTLGLDPARRLGYLGLARSSGMPAVAVLFDTDPAECRRRNRGRDPAVPAPALEGQLRRMRAAATEVRSEGWDLVTTTRSAQPEASHSPGAQAAASEQRQRPVRLGFVLQLSRFLWDEDPEGPAHWLAAVARAAAEAGLQGIALMDHLIQIPQVGRAWEPIPEPWVTLGMLAGLEPGLRLGTLVTPVTFRAPGILAKTVATLDALSGGRAFCGIGAGWWAREHAGFGLPFPAAGTRLDELESAIETLRALWQPGTREYRSERVWLPETTCYPRPVSPIPIIVGGGGEKRTLAIAARLGDGCNLPSDLGTLDRKLAVFREHCAAAGRDPAQAEVTVLDVPVIGRDREEAASIVERLRGRTSAAAFARSHHAGTAEEHIGRYRLLADRGVATVFVSLPDLAGPQDVLRLAPVAAAFALLSGARLIVGPMIRTLAIENYRSLRRVIIPLAGLNLVTGANGSGKSSLYRALRLLADSARNGAVAALAREGGLPSTLWAGPEKIGASVREGRYPVQGTVRGQPVSLRLGFGADDFSYAIDFGLPPPSQTTAFALDPEIKRECVWRGPVLRPAALLCDRHNGIVRLRGADGGWAAPEPISGYDSMLSEFADPQRAPEILTLRERIRSWRFYDYFRTDLLAPARSSQIGTRTPVLGHDGADVASALQTIREVGNAAALDVAVDLAFPGSRIGIEWDSEGRIDLRLHQHGLLRPLGVAELSDGTLRYLLWAAALLTPRPPGLLVLNEPETSLHSDLLAPLAQLISRAADESQIIVVSHSRGLVDALGRAARHGGAELNAIELEKEFGQTRVVGQDVLEQPAWHWPKRLRGGTGYRCAFAGPVGNDRVRQDQGGEEQPADDQVGSGR